MYQFTDYFSKYWCKFVEFSDGKKSGATFKALVLDAGRIWNYVCA